jgi:hypothetical protein
VHEADEPDPNRYLANADILTGEHGAQVDLPATALA